jgi:hypothetical protein
MWIDGFPSCAAWIGGVPDPASPRPRGLALDRMDRRRASMLSRAIADAAAEAIADAAVDPSSVPAVIGSSIGEATTMIGLLDQMFRKRESVSPAAFTMSVHNAASGLMSISSGNRGFTTSLAADDDTPMAALLEAAGVVLTTGRPVLVACADESPPANLVPAHLMHDMLAAAVVLAPSYHQGPLRAQLRLRAGMPATLAPVLLPGRLERSPQVGLLDLVLAVLGGARGRLRLNRWREDGWCAEIAGPAAA